MAEEKSRAGKFGSLDVVFNSIKHWKLSDLETLCSARILRPLNVLEPVCKECAEVGEGENLAFSGKGTSLSRIIRALEKRFDEADESCFLNQIIDMIKQSLLDCADFDVIPDGLEIEIYCNNYVDYEETGDACGMSDDFYLKISNRGCVAVSSQFAKNVEEIEGLKFPYDDVSVDDVCRLIDEFVLAGSVEYLIRDNVQVVHRKLILDDAMTDPICCERIEFDELFDDRIKYFSRDCILAEMALNQIAKEYVVGNFKRGSCDLRMPILSFCELKLFGRGENGRSLSDVLDLQELIEGLRDMSWGSAGFSWRRQRVIFQTVLG